MAGLQSPEERREVIDRTFALTLAPITAPVTERLRAMIAVDYPHLAV